MEKQKIVIDTNVIFIALLNTSSTIGDLVLNSDNVFEFYSCSLLKEEIREHQAKILKISGFTESELAILCQTIFAKITFISEEIIPFEYWQNALPIVRDIDIDDIAFVALADLLDAKLWTGDKKLLKSIRAKG
ncbi:PIN domain-containing protein [Thermoflexibacter ruber]|uniref:Predicted nucleic acid-binding protein, contains PIN domain n=1 Tax=Thermoflexibacter ruber TaxID=1003 RepID=A0A1I2IPF9_9BACT|nr:PIN domain-containing protein [Thermoflexibacter ruber]SFF43518.1 Predicted nucleic acid-binding protein, contains PIN domain [Thermoflexibacter ruber]